MENKVGFTTETINVNYIDGNIFLDTTSSPSPKEYQKIVDAFKEYIKSRGLNTGKNVEGKLEIVIRIEDK